MIRKILTPEVYAGAICRPVNTTVENGLFHSVLKPTSGLVRDLLETAKFHEGSIVILTANQIGYLANAMVFNLGNGFGVLLNPTAESKSSHGNGYYKKITVSFCDQDGFNRSVRFRREDARRIQEGLRRLGVL